MTGKVKLIALIKAKPGMSPEELKKYYLEKHAPIDLQFKNLRGYTFNLTKKDDPSSVDGSSYDGVAELWWDSKEDMDVDFASKAGVEGGEDVQAFASEIISLNTEEYVILKRE